MSKKKLMIVTTHYDCNYIIIAYLIMEENIF